MTQLKTTFANNNSINVDVALNAAAGELASIERQIASGSVVSATLLMRRAQLKQIIAELRARAVSGQTNISRKNDNGFFAVIAALVYVKLANQAAHNAAEARNTQRRNERRSLKAQFAPRLAA